MAPNKVLIIGGGIAGLCAAIAARRLGVAAHVLESAPQALRGGNARHARNFRIAHEKPVWHTPDAYSAAEFLSELRKTGCPDEALAHWLVEESAVCADWLMGCGVRLQAPDVGVLPYSRRTAFLLGGGKAMVNALYETASRLGVGFDYDSEAVGLTQTLDGWEAEIATGERIRARAVVVASGGPGGDPVWRKDHIGEDILLRGSRSSDGRMMQSLVEHGFRTVGDPSSCHMVAVDARGPEDDGGIVTRITAIPRGLVVDRNARRVELAGVSAGKSHYAQWGPRIAGCDGGIAFLILDANSFARALPTALAPVRAETLDALAAALGMDGAALAVAVGDSIVEPPFFGFPMRAGLTFVHFGLAVDADMRLMREGETKNLFGAGMIVAPNFFTRSYLAGLGLTLSAVTGRRAGEAAARHVHS